MIRACNRKPKRRTEIHVSSKLCLAAHRLSERMGDAAYCGYLGRHTSLSPLALWERGWGEGKQQVPQLASSSAPPRRKGVGNGTQQKRGILSGGGGTSGPSFPRPQTPTPSFPLPCIRRDVDGTRPPRSVIALRGFTNPKNNEKSVLTALDIPTASSSNAFTWRAGCKERDGWQNRNAGPVNRNA